MTTLEEVQNMKDQGYNDDEIISSLEEQGVSPKEIYDSLNQAQIQGDISNIQGSNNDETYSPEYPQYKEQNQSGGHITPMSQESDEIYAPQQYAEEPMQTQGAGQYAEQEMSYPEQNYNQAYAPQQGYETEYNSEGYDSSSMMDIAEQIIDNKLVPVIDKINNLSEFKTIIQSQVENIEIRLKKIESVIDRLQITILEKVGSYGDNLSSIKREMSMMQESFGKVINPLTDRNLESSSKTLSRKKR